MQIIDPKVEIIKEKKPFKKIEMAGRTCYKSESSITDDSAMAFYDRLVKSQHTAMLEHATFVFKTNEHVYNAAKECKYLNATKNTLVDFSSGLSEIRYLVSGNLRAINESGIDPLIGCLFYEGSGNGKLAYAIFSQNEYAHAAAEDPATHLINFEDINDVVPEEIAAHKYTTMRFTTNRGCCYDEKTKVLTKNGWKYFDDVSCSDFVASIDDNNNIVWVNPIKVIKERYIGEMDHWSSCFVDLVVTPNHNMWLYDYNKRNPATRTWKFIKSEDAKNKRYLFQKTANKVIRDSNFFFTIPGAKRHRGFYDKTYEPLTVNAENFFEFLGLWITDGCISKSDGTYGNRVIITQKKENVRKRIEFLLESMNFKYSKCKFEYYISCPQLYDFLYNHFIIKDDLRKTYYIRIPRVILETASCSELTALLNGIILGDGSYITNGKGHQIYTCSKGFTEDLMELALYIGKSAKIRSIPPRDRLFPGKTSVTHCKPQYVVSITDMPKTLFATNGSAKKTKEFYDGYVYCVELPIYHKLFVMRNGVHCVCGNSHELVRHRPFSFAEESTRYVNLSKDQFGGGNIKFIKPAGFDEWSMDMRQHLEGALREAEKYYNRLIMDGAKAQQARAVLPNAVKTEIIVTGNDTEWQHFFNLRSKGTTGAPHPDMKMIADMALELYNKNK